ncbi:MAG: MBOAT family protein [Oscillospiraceae bacterium]|nr:MBOAT family protein [Oscillospiraceae bacterium]
MVFSSLTFLFLFLPIFFLVYLIAPKFLRNTFLFAGGLIFYSWGEPFYVFVLVISTLIDYGLGMVMHKYDEQPTIRKIALIASIFMNLSLLGLFKYGGFIAGNINFLAGRELFNINLPLPIGISFYTFQTLSYSIDLYRRKIAVQKNPVNFAAFVTMFPQVVAGPIVRYEDVADELDNRRITLTMVYEGICRFVIGLGKKVLIANNVGVLWATVKGAALAGEYAQLSATTAWLGITAFTFQIYFDFSGYSDMAIGLGKMMGFKFPENFNYPYSSLSISEFWRRWHITLGNWFKSYVYFPMGGSRRGTGRTLINLGVVWLLTGIWHGASWNFIAWGVFMGVMIILERLFLGAVLEKLPWFLSNVYVMVTVMLMWVLFDLPTFSDAAAYIGVMFGQGGNGLFLDQQAAYMIINYGVMFTVCIIACSELPKNVVSAVNKRFPVLVDYGTVPVIIAIFLGCTAYLVNTGYNPFLYFNF